MVGFAMSGGMEGRSEKSGVFGSATGVLKNVTLCILGSRIDMSSLEYSFDE